MKALHKLYKSNELLFTIIWIVAYIVLMSIGDNLSSLIGIEKVITIIIALVLSITLFLFMKCNSLLDYYGLHKSSIPSKKLLFYIPCLIMLSINVIFGLTLKYTILESILYIITMLCVGFLEEVIFRGLLFNYMKKTNLTSAIIVSSITFGIGHIVNLINGSGADLIPNLLQVLYATSAGFMFVMLYYKTDSLIICILSHGLFNALSAFSVAPSSLDMIIISSVALIIITGSYALFLLFTNRKKEDL